MPLSDTAIRNAKPRERPYKLGDTGGLFLLVTPSGGKWWRLKYRFGGKAKLLSLGVYPQVSLKEPRARRDAARSLIARGIDPSAARKAEKAADVDSFEAVAREWYAKHAPLWGPGQAHKITRLLERDVFPWLGARPIGQTTAPELLACLRRIEDRGTIDSAHRMHQVCGQVFRYAVATGRAERDPAADLRGALPPAKAKLHYASLTDPKAIGGLLRVIDGYQGSLVTQCALRLAPLTFVRPGELRQAEWSEIDLEVGEWRIPADRMKMKSPHIVPLARQAVEVLRKLHSLTGTGHYVFPGMRTPTRPMSENTVNAALRCMGYNKNEMTCHGFRAAARTILEVLGERPDLIEHQLAHVVRDPLGRGVQPHQAPARTARDDAAVGGLLGRVEERRRGGAAAVPRSKSV